MWSHIQPGLYLGIPHVTVEAYICPRITSPPETLKSDGTSSTLRTLTFPSSTYADHLHLIHTIGNSVSKAEHVNARWMVTIDQYKPG